VLSPREREVVSLLVKGLRNKEIAAHLHISERTVKFHVGRIFDKLCVDSRVEVLLRVAKEGLLASSSLCPPDDDGNPADRGPACRQREEDM
jgi:DNA-binding NarL/FixJ family response regulator